MISNENKTYILMMKDTPVLKFNFSEGFYAALDMKYIPFQLKNAMSFTVPGQEHEGMESAAKINCEAVMKFLANRMLSSGREYADKILRVLGKPQEQDLHTRANAALSFYAVTLQDNYWVCEENEQKSWKQVDLRQNPISEIVAEVALHGSRLSLHGEVHTPELTTQGTYAKCWKCEDGGLYLYKRGYKGDTESRIEVEASNILDKCSVSHLGYEKAADRGVYCCKCKCMTDQRISMLHADEFISYCILGGLDWYKTALSIDSDSIYKMFIVDYLLSNSDRHNLNWGFFYDCDTMEILSCHPLYDHNNAFNEKIMKNDNAKSLVLDGVTMRSLALEAMSRVDFHFTQNMKKTDFLSKEHYTSFMKRAEYLRVETRS